MCGAPARNKNAIYANSMVRYIGSGCRWVNCEEGVIVLLPGAISIVTLGGSYDRIVVHVYPMMTLLLIVKIHIFFYY